MYVPDITVHVRVGLLAVRMRMDVDPVPYPVRVRLVVMLMRVCMFVCVGMAMITVMNVLVQIGLALVNSLPDGLIRVRVNLLIDRLQALGEVDCSPEQDAENVRRFFEILGPGALPQPLGHHRGPPAGVCGERGYQTGPRRSDQLRVHVYPKGGYLRGGEDVHSGRGRIG